MKTNRSYFPVRILALVLCFSLAGCGAGAANRSVTQEYGYTDGSLGYASAKSAAPVYSSAAEEMYFDEDEYEYEDDVSFDSGSSSFSAGSETTVPPSSEDTGRILAEKLIYTGNLSVETTDFSSTLTRIKRTINEMGGFIETENDSDDSYGWYLEGYRKSSSTLHSYIRARIPSARFYEFLDGVEGESSKVTDRSVNVENISRRYSEVATTIESYEIQERRLLDMMEDATRVSDMLEIEARLSEVQGYLKQYRNSLSDMDTDVAYSTVSINIREVGIYSRPEAATFSEKIQKSFSDGLYQFKEGVQNFCIWLAGNFLDVIVFFLLIWLMIVIIRKIIKSIRKEKKPGEKRRKGKKGMAEALSEAEVSEEKKPAE